MSKGPIRTLTVCAGRELLGFIHQTGDRQYSAQLCATGKTLGVFPTTGEAAKAINEGYKKTGSAAR
jgi:hypothetical protein